MVIGLVDDGVSSIESTSQAIIHNIRLPWPKNADYYYFKEIIVVRSEFLGNWICLARGYFNLNGSILWVSLFRLSPGVVLTQVTVSAHDLYFHLN